MKIPGFVGPPLPGLLAPSRSFAWPGGEPGCPQRWVSSWGSAPAWPQTLWWPGSTGGHCPNSAAPCGLAPAGLVLCSARVSIPSCIPVLHPIPHPNPPSQPHIPSVNPSPAPRPYILTLRLNPPAPQPYILVLHSNPKSCPCIPGLNPNPHPGPTSCPYIPVLHPNLASCPRLPSCTPVLHPVPISWSCTPQVPSQAEGTRS